MKSNLFSLSHSVKLSCNMGELIPIACYEVAPGDVVRQQSFTLVRTQPLATPVMHKVNVELRTFYYPFRCMMDGWEDFYTGGRLGTDTTQWPHVACPASTGFAIGSLADYLGVPTGVPDKLISAFPFRMYADTVNEYYLDQLLQTPLTVSRAAGLDTTTSLALKNACWEKDYFTSARPEPQLGTDVALPLAGDAPITGLGTPDSNGQFTTSTTMRVTGGVTEAGDWTSLGGGTTTTGVRVKEDPDNPEYPGVFADLSNVSAATVNDLRLATALQRYKENMLRFGARYVERLMTAFGVNGLDARLQIPELLGTQRQVIQFSEVLGTANTEDGSIGDLYGHGIAAGGGRPFKRFIPEPGLIMTLMVVRPVTMYPQSLNRMWMRRTKEDYLQPELVNLGQQEVYDGEADLAHTNQFDVWGYQDRYDDYRRIESRVAGEFRDTLDDWHMARLFDTPPELNSDFVTANPTDRIYQAPEADQLYIQAIHKIKCKRRLPKVSKPMLF